MIKTVSGWNYSRSMDVWAHGDRWDSSAEVKHTLKQLRIYLWTEKLRGEQKAISY